MKEIDLGKGLTTTVDDALFELLSGFEWYGRQHGTTAYAVTDWRGKIFPLHRLVMGVHQYAPGLEVDHIDGDGLNNQRANLRLVTHLQNSQNRVGSGRFRKLKGAYFRKGKNVWRARITVDKRQIHLGDFSTEEEAARIYDIAAKQYFGQYARLNFPPQQESLLFEAA